jgi:hypothetical protein
MLPDSRAQVTSIFFALHPISHPIYSITTVSTTTSIIRKPIPNVLPIFVLPPVKVAATSLLVLLYPAEEVAFAAAGLELLDVVVKFAFATAILSQKSQTV